MCEGVDIMWCLYVIPLLIPPQHTPTGRGDGFYKHYVDQYVGLAAGGGAVTAVLDYCDVCDVNIVLEALGVSNSGEK